MAAICVNYFNRPYLSIKEVRKLIKEGVDDEHLLRQITKGSIQAFEQFYDRHIRFVYGISLKMLKNPIEAEDMCHDIFLEVYKNAHSFNANRGSAMAWLAVKTKSRCLDYLRKKQRMEEIEVEAILSHKEAGGLSVEEQAFRNIDTESLIEAFKQLPEAQKRAIYGNYFEYRTHQELSKDLNQPLGTIKSWVRYGIQNLRKQFKQAGFKKVARGEERHGR